MTEVIFHKNIYILLVDDVTLTVYKVMSFNIRSPLTKTLDRSVETLGRECNLCVVISFIQQNQSSTYVRLCTWLRYSHKIQFKMQLFYDRTLGECQQFCHYIINK